MKLRWATGTDVGRVRSNNQDTVYPAPGDGEAEAPMLVAVADGMGGHVGGEVASTTAIAALQATDGDPAARIAAANRAVLSEVATEPALRGMGTTLTVAAIETDGTVTIGHVGDSRAYRWHDGNLEQLTRDHTVVAEYLAAGKITRAEARNHPQRSVITRAVGVIDPLDIDQFTVHCSPGDRLLLCSDGLTSMVDDADIAEALATNTPRAAVDHLIDMANAAGGVDNVSIAVVAFDR